MADIIDPVVPPEAPDPIVATAQLRLRTAGVTPGFITIIIQLIQSLISGCGPAPAKNQVTRNPARVRRRFLYEAYSMTGDMADATEIADGAIIVAKQSTVEEYGALMTADLNKPANQ
jgi:hypothetical protein